MTITALPSAPSRADPSTFSAKGDALLGALATFVTEANALETNVNAKEVTVVADEILCTAAAATALSASNYKGPWASQSGTAVVPYAVSYLGNFWQLASNLADVTTKTPGTDAEWLLIVPGIIWSVITGATNAVIGNGYICDTSGAPFTLTLPAAPSPGNVIGVTDRSGTFHTNNLTIGRNSLRIMGLAEDLTVSTQYAAFSLVYADATNGWRIA